jgi:hypothetical protein
MNFIKYFRKTPPKERGFVEDIGTKCITGILYKELILLPCLRLFAAFSITSVRSRVAIVLFVETFGVNLEPIL